MSDCAHYLVSSLGWSAVWLIFGYVAATAYFTRGNL